jgi:hypothetical protein
MPVATNEPMRLNEVKPLVLYKYARRLRDFKIDPEDFAQDVCATILRRQNMKSAWDPSRCAWSTYVLWISRTELNHQTRVCGCKKQSAFHLANCHRPRFVEFDSEVHGDSTESPSERVNFAAEQRRISAAEELCRKNTPQSRQRAQKILLG